MMILVGLHRFRPRASRDPYHYPYIRRGAFGYDPFDRDRSRCGSFTMTSLRKRVLSGMQPSGLLHLGNYLGALENWKAAAGQNMTVTSSWRIGMRSRRIMPIPAASGNSCANCSSIGWRPASIPRRATVFIQSHIPEHAILHLLLSMMTPISWLERNPTYKEKQEEIKEKDLTHLWISRISRPASRRYSALQTGFRPGREGSAASLGTHTRSGQTVQRPL